MASAPPITLRERAIGLRAAGVPHLEPVAQGRIITGSLRQGLGLGLGLVKLKCLSESKGKPSLSKHSPVRPALTPDVIQRQRERCAARVSIAGRTGPVRPKNLRGGAQGFGRQQWTRDRGSFAASFQGQDVVHVARVSSTKGERRDALLNIPGGDTGVVKRHAAATARGKARWFTHGVEEEEGYIFYSASPFSFFSVFGFKGYKKKKAERNWHPRDLAKSFFGAAGV